MDRYILNKFSKEDQREIKSILSRAKEANGKTMIFQKIKLVYDDILRGIKQDKIKTALTIYVFTYLFLVGFAYDPFTSFFGSVFVNIFVAAFYSILTTIFVFIPPLIIRAILYFIEPMRDAWKNERHIFQDFVDKKKSKTIYGEAEGDFFDREEEKRQMDMFAKNNKNYHTPISRSWVEEI